MHSLTPENPGYASSQHYLDDLQRKSVEGQIAYEKRKAIQRRLRMKKGIKQAQQFYHYTEKHGYGKDQDLEMWHTLAQLKKPQKIGDSEDVNRGHAIE